MAVEPQEDPHKRQAVLRFSPRSQLAFVAVAHVIILVGVTTIMVEGVGEGPPPLFILGEAVIILVCATLALGDFEPLVKPIYDARDLTPAEVIERKVRAERRRATAAPLVLYGACAVQLLALIPLFEVTGGVVNGLFSELAVALAAFTPLLANKVVTALRVLALNIAYYIALAVALDNTDCPSIGEAWYAAVNLVILMLAVGFGALDFAARRNRLSA